MDNMDDEDEQRLRTIREVFEEGAWVGADCLRELNRPIATWEDEGRVFAIEYEGRRYYPRYQFDASLQPLPVIRDIIAAFGEAEPWTLAAWFHYPSAWLVERDEQGARTVAPKDAMDRGADLVSAAAKRLSGWVA